MLFDSSFHSELVRLLWNCPGYAQLRIGGGTPAIRWLEVGWANSRTVGAHAHVMALRAGFDVLFGGSRTNEIRDALSALLDDAGAERTPREWDDHNGRRSGPFDLTDLEWWFQSFALLRNAIVHGGVVADDAWDFHGVPHIWHAERNLRRAIKKIVGDAGHEDVLLDPFERIARRFAAEMIVEDEIPEG